MKIATWNVNSLRMRLEHLTAWAAAEQIDAVALQETKTTDADFPLQALTDSGWGAVYTGQKSYNGVAVLYRKDRVRVAGDTVNALPGYLDEQKRFLAVPLCHEDGTQITLTSVYFPNGEAPGAAKYLYKLEWIAALTLWVKSVAGATPLVLAGDMNVAPGDDDVWNPTLWRDKILVSAPERSAFRELLKAGLTDTWSLELHAPGTFSWWDYRNRGFELNEGLRIDHILASNALASRIHNVHVDTAPRALEKPSDHAPVVCEISPV